MIPEHAIAELRRSDGRVAGLAFVIGPNRLVTCAHVVNAALGRAQRDATTPGAATLWLDFPFGGRRDEPTRRKAAIVSWLPARGSFDLHDVAVLQIDEDLPTGVEILPLADADPRGQVQMWGPVEDRRSGGHVSGLLLGEVDKSRLQVDQQLRGVFRVRPGFSGGPVWQPASNRVVGMLQAAAVDDDASDAYVLGVDLIIDACRELPDHDWAVNDPALTILHLSNLRFRAERGRTAEFPSSDISQPIRLANQFVAQLEGASPMTPDLIVVSGDIAEDARPAEYEMAYSFLAALLDRLQLDPDRLVIVPGSHDVNRRKCQAYFLDQEAEDLQPSPPYWPKWEPFAALFTRLNETEFPMDQPWQFVELPELKLVVAAMNSTMAESHRAGDSYGWLGREQMSWFAQQLAGADKQNWFRIGLVNHNPRQSTTDGTAFLRDAELFDELLGPRLNLILHGRPDRPAQLGEAKVMGSPADMIPGAAGTGRDVLYALIEVRHTGLSVTTDKFSFDNSSSLGPVPGRVPEQFDIPAAFRRAEAIFPPSPLLPSADVVGRTGGGATGPGQEHDDLLSRMAEVCRLRLPDAQVRIMRPPGEGDGYLHVAVVRTISDGQRVAVEQYPIGACQGDATDEQVDRFIRTVGSRYLAGAIPASYKLVYDGPPARPPVRERALRRRVELLSFAEYQLGYDLRPYARRQAERLARDTAYSPALYVPQRYTEIGNYGVPGAAPIQEDVLERLRAWLAEPDGHLVVVLGPFGHGKTFLLRELTRRMYAEGDPAVPVLVHLRDLEKAHDLNQLVAAQLTAGGERRIDLAMFRYLLSEGRIALLFDGFDELAVRVTYDAAAQHLDTILRAADGRAKIVLVSRDQHFLTDAEVLSALGDRLTTLAGRRLVKLANFDDNQIAAFLRNRLRDGESVTRRLDLLQDVKDLLGLSRNPRMLDFITQIPEDQLKAARQRTGEITAAGLYGELLNQWLQYELKRRDRPGGVPPPSEEQFWHAVTSLALRLWGLAEEGVGVAALGETADELARLAIPGGAAGVALPDRDETAHAIGSGTLLVRDSEGRFTFVHQSVMEWVVARYIAERIRREEQLPELERREMSTLMVDFLCDLLGRETAFSWAAAQLAKPTPTKGLRESVLLIHKRLGRDIIDGRLAGSDLRGEDLSGQVLQRANLADADLTEAILNGSDLTGANLQRVSLVRARMHGSQLRQADLRNANLTGASLLGANLTGADLTGAVLRGAALVGAQVSPESLARAKTTWGMAPPTGESPIVQYRSRATGMRAVAASPGLVAAGGDDGVLRIWDPATGEQVREWTGHSDEILSVDFTGDGRWLASGGAGGMVRIWDPVTGEQVREVRGGHTGRVWSVRFSADGNRLASAGGDGVVKIWDTATGDLERDLTGHIFVVWSVDFSPDGRWLASAGGGQVVRIYDLERATIMREWAAHASAVLCVRFSHDGKLASAGADGAVRIWDLMNGSLVREWSGHVGPVWSVDFSPDGRRLVSAGDDPVVRIWDPTTGECLHELAGHTEEVNSAAFSPEGRWLASAGTDRVVHIWDPVTGGMVRRWTGHTDEINSVGFSSDGKWLAAAGDDKMVRIWNIASGSLEYELTGHTGRIWSMAFSPDSRWLASAGADGLVRIWDTAVGRLVHELIGHTGRVRSLRFTPDGARLASAGDDRLVRIWDPVAGLLVHEWIGHTGRVRSLAFTPDGLQLASGGDDGVVRIWDPETGTQIREWTGQIGAIWAVWFSPDGRQLAVGSTSGKVFILDSATGSTDRDWNSHNGAVSCVAFSPGGRWLVSAGTVGGVRIWDATSGTEQRQLTGHTGAVWSIGFSPDGRLLASAGADGVLRVWDTETGVLRAALLSLTDGWATLGPGLNYKLYGNAAGEFWYVLGLCRFEPGELDAYLPQIRRLDLTDSLPEINRVNPGPHI